VIDLDVPATEVFQILRSFAYTVELYDDSGNRVLEPATARRMFASPENLMVAVVDDGDNSAIKLFYGPSTEVTKISGLMQSLRMAAVKFNLLFSARQFGREITPKEFSSAHSVYESAGMETNMDVFEGMYGTSRSSYLKLEGARMIVRHSARIDPEKPGARGRHVDQIFVENQQGERILFPVNIMAPARAMTSHVANGGNFADSVGAQIIRMANDYKNLATVSRHIVLNGDSLEESANEVGTTCRTKMREMRRVFERLYRQTTYGSEAKKIMEAAKALTENGTGIKPERIDEIRSMLAIEGKMIDDEVLESVAMAMEDVEAGRLIVEAKPVARAYVGVMGRKVDAETWQAFKAGTLDINGTPNLSGARYASKDAELAHKLGAIVPIVKDDSMMGLLSYVSDALLHGGAVEIGISADDDRPMKSDPDTMRKLRTIASHAIKAVGLTEALATNAKPIREFAEWVNGFKLGAIMEGFPETVNAYNDPGRWTSDDQAREDAIDMIVGSFDPVKFLASEAANDHLYWRGHEELSPEDKEVSRHEIASGIESYLNAELSAEGFEFGDFAEDAQRLVDMVVPLLDAAGYTVIDPMMEGDDLELSSEDILLPPDDPGADFIDDVTLKNDDGGGTKTELDRLMTLSGRM
jgi:hypothetical protein